ncbi:MAG: oligosaccharide flippase family protein, partial [Patescibacteria group bacterium]
KLAIKISLKSLWRYGSMVLWFTVVSQFFYNFDMLFVKAFFSATEAGFYGALLTIGRIVYFIGGSVPLVMFPVIAGLKDDVSPRKYKVLLKSLGLMAILAVPTALFIALFPELVIKIIVGAQYLSLAQYLPIFVWGMFFLTVMTVLAQYFLALAKKSGLIILTVGVAFETAVLGRWHDNFWQIIFGLLIVFGLISIGLLTVCCRDYIFSKQNYDKEK